MSSSFCKTLTFFIICMVLQESWGRPLSDEADLPATGSHPHHVRTKRCSCNSWDDKECIYFCHLDIIWINTPSKLLPYGLGSPLSHRRRRSADRCKCLNPDDKTCSSFCHESSENQKTRVAHRLVNSARSNGNKWLGFYRLMLHHGYHKKASITE